MTTNAEMSLDLELRDDLDRVIPSGAMIGLHHLQMAFGHIARGDPNRDMLDDLRFILRDGSDELFEDSLGALYAKSAFPVLAPDAVIHGRRCWRRDAILDLSAELYELRSVAGACGEGGIAWLKSDLERIFQAVKSEAPAMAGAA